jgi:hypothetical protein
VCRQAEKKHLAFEGAAKYRNFRRISFIGPSADMIFSSSELNFTLICRAFKRAGSAAFDVVDGARSRHRSAIE